MNQLFGTPLANVGPAQFTRLVERLLWHLGFTAVSNIDGANDGGADIVAVRSGQAGSREGWAFQCKSKRTSPVTVEAVDEIVSGMLRFNSDVGVVVTNATFTRAATERAAEMTRVAGMRLQLWDASTLQALFDDPAFPSRFGAPDLRRYQVDAFQACTEDLRRTGRALMFLATGLGKTVVAGSVIDRAIANAPDVRVLVLAEKVDLVEQLERALWRHLPRDVPTQQVHGAERPNQLDGVTVGTVQSAISYVRSGFRPDFIFVDEAHHVSADGQFREILDTCDDAARLGATATPWRGDEFDIRDVFGEPSIQIGIEEGMRLGYLADVRYRVYNDNVDWEFVRSLSANSYSLPDLNRRLFMPQLDERIRDELLEVWIGTSEPRSMVFCSTVEHVERLLATLKRVPMWSNAAALHSRMPAYERKANLARYRMGEIPILVAVDVLNEGVDVPDVNIVCFARVTHSRRIFIQQLGRGLRLREGKSHVTVLDFVSDLRRMKAVLDLKSGLDAGPEDVLLPASHSITFTDASTESFFREWLLDQADLDTAADVVRLDYPPSL